MGDQSGEHVEHDIYVESSPTKVQALEDQAIIAQALVDPNNKEDQAVKNPYAFKEIANLQDINDKYPFLKLALHDWERKREHLDNIISRREGQINDLTNQIFSLVGIFAVFQGVVLSAVSQLKQSAHPELGGVPVCGKIWFPIALTVFVTLVTVVGILHQYESLQSLKRTIHMEREALIEFAQRALSLRRVGPKNFNFSEHTDDSSLVTKPKLAWNRFCVILSVVIFTCLCILSYFVILCDTGVIRKWDKGIHG